MVKIILFDKVVLVAVVEAGEMNLGLFIVLGAVTQGTYRIAKGIVTTVYMGFIVTANVQHLFNIFRLHNFLINS